MAGAFDEWDAKYGSVKKPKSRDAFSEWDEQYGVNQPDPLDFPLSAVGDTPAPNNSLFREVADTGLSLARGLVGAGQSITNLAGADNMSSRGLGLIRDGLGSLQSDEQQAQRKSHSARMKDAEGTGSFTEEVKAAWQNFKEDPLDYAAEGLGSVAVAAPVRLISKGAQIAGVSGRAVGLMGLGGAQGVGSVKGAQYDAMKEAKLADGYSDEQARALASEAQSYKSENALDLLTGFGIGVVAGGTGADRVIGGAAGAAGRGLVKRAAVNTLAEGSMEGLQGGQERYAANQALIRDGYDVNPWKGVAGNATTEALMSAPVGAATGALEGYTPTDAETAEQQTRQAEYQRQESDAALAAQRQAEEQQVAEKAKAERDASRTYYAEQLPFETFKKQRVDEITDEQITPEIIDEAYQEEFKAAVAQEIAPPDRTKFEKQYKAKVKKEIAKSTDELTQEYYETLDHMAATGVDLLGDPTELNTEGEVDPGTQPDATVEPQTNRRQMDFLSELDRTVQPGYSPVMPVATPGEGTPESTTFTQTPVDDSGLPGALQEAKARAGKGGVTEAPPNYGLGGNPLMAARDAAMQNGVSRGSWAKFVSTRQLGNATPDAIAEAIRDRAINGSGSNNPAWEAAHAAVTGISIDDHISKEESNESVQANETASQEAASQVPATRAATTLVQAQVNTPAVVVPQLATQQKRVYDVLVEAAQEGDLENYIASDGTINYQRISDKMGIPRQSAKAAIDQTVKRFEQANGGNLRETLRNRTKAVRTTELADEDMLGTSPANFTKGSLQVGAKLDKSDLFGDDAGADQSFGVVETVGGSQSATDANADVPVDNTPDPVAERRQAEALERNAAFQREALSRPEAAEAASDWDDMRSSHAPFAKDLSRQDAYEWLMNYVEWKHGNSTEETLAADQLDIERRYDADPSKAVGVLPGAGETATAKPALAEGDRKVEAPARPNAEETAGDAGEDTQGLDVDALTGLLAQLRGLGNEPKHAATAKDFLKRAINGENVEAEAGAWVNAVNEDKRGEMLFSRDGGSEGQDAAKLRDHLRKMFVNPALFDKRVTVVQSEADLPAKYNTRQSKQDATRMAFYDTTTGNVYMIADNIPPGRGFSVFLHEVGGHMGMRNLLGKANFDALYGQINTWAEGTGSVENDVAKAALDRVLNAGVIAEGEVKEELIAYFVEEAVRRGINPSALATQPKTMQAWFRTLWNAVKTAVQKLGINPATLTAKDVVDLAYGAARLELNGSQTDIDAAADASGRPATSVAFVEPPSDAAVMNSIKSEKRKVDAVIDDLPKHLSEPAHWMNTNFGELAKGAKNLIGFTDQLVDSAKGVLPTAKAWFEAMKTRETVRIRNEERVDQIAREVDKLSQGEFNRTWTLLRDMTREKKWGYAPHWKPDAVVSAEMSARYLALGATEKAVVDAVLKHGHDTLVATNAQLTTIANDLFDEKIARTRDPVKKQQLTGDKAQYLRVYGRKLLVPSDPYAPMRRVGTHATVGKSQLYLDAEAKAKAGDKKAVKQLDELRADDRHHLVAFSDNLYEAERIAREYRAAGLTATASVKEVFTSDDQLPFQSFQTLREMANEKDGDHSAKLMNMIDELYLESLSDVSARKSELRRVGVGGLDADTMYKAFLAHGKSSAHYMSVLKTHRNVAGKFAEMRTQAHATGGDRHARMSVFNEMKKRFDASFNFEPSPVISKLMSASTYWMLLTKPAYYLYNLTQPLMMTLPYMTKRHDYTAAANQMVRAYSDLMKLPKAVSFEHFDLRALPADIRDAIIELRDMGRIDITITQDLGKRVHAGVGNASKYVARMDGFFRSMAQKTEMANRIVTAASAYRLHMAKNPNDRAGAMAYAADVIDKTQGDYSNFNAPRLFNMNSAARLLTQFKKFQLIQASFLISMVKGIKDPHERAANTRALMFTLGHHALFAGAMGLPAMNLIAMAFAASGDDEEPKNLELWMKNNLGDDDIGKVLRYGLPSLFNVNMSGNIGMGQTFSVIPYADVDATRSGYDSMITSLAGPTFGGLFPQFWAASAKGLQGDYYGFLSGLMPGFVKSTMRAIGESSEGVKTGAGDVVVSAEDIAMTDTLMKSLGFKTVNDTTRQLVTGKRYEFEAFFRDKTRDIKKEYNDAYREGDGAKLEELRESWMNLQSFKRDYGFKAQGISDLLKAPIEQGKRERNTISGVQFDDGNRGFVDAYASDEIDQSQPGSR